MRRNHKIVSYITGKKLTWLSNKVGFFLRFFFVFFKVRTFNYRFQTISDVMKETSSWSVKAATKKTRKKSTTTASISDSTSTEAGSTADVSSVPGEAVHEETSLETAVHEETTMMPMNVEAEIVELKSSRSFTPPVTSTPQSVPKCKKCPQKAKKIKDLQRKNRRLEKRLKSLEEIFIRLQNSQVQFSTV